MSRIMAGLRTWFCFMFMTGVSVETDPHVVKIDGDIILGGLFPMHEKGTGGKACGALKEEKGIQRMEAMLYTIDKINRDPNLLPNITLGAHILDTCSRDTYALEQTLDFIKAHLTNLDITDYRCANGTPPIYTPAKPVAGVIGAAASTVSTMVANILRLFKIPQISYASTGIELSDKTRFEYFSRVVPPDTFQAQAMVDLVRAFGWSYVSTLADEGNYGEKGIGAFEELAKKSQICIARSLKLPREPDENTYRKIIIEFLNYRKAKVIVMFVNEDNCRRLLKASIDLAVWDQLYWLASDSWGAKIHPVEGQGFAAEGAVTILPKRQTLIEFDNYFTNLTLEGNTRNPWFSEFWERHFKCKFTGGNSTCTGKETIAKSTSNYEQEGVVPFVVDAVYAMAHALENMQTTMCGGAVICSALSPPEGSTLLQFIRNVSFTGKPSAHVQEGLVPFVVDAVYTMAYAIQRMHQEKCRDHVTVCRAMRPVGGPALLHYIRNVSFVGAAGHTVQFNENGDAMGRYSIYQYQQTGEGTFGYVEIGEWSHKLILHKNKTSWRQQSIDFPRSVCSEPCLPGYMKSSKEDACCWTCIKCQDHQFLQESNNCTDCPLGHLPNLNKTACLPLRIQFMALDSPWAMVPVVFASLGIICTIFVFVIFLRFNKTPIIMASGRELCYVLLFGIFMSYVMSFVMVAKPTLVSCTLLRLGLGLSLSVCYSALFTKTNRIARIFNRGIKAVMKRPSYTSPRSQLVVCSCLIAVQVIGAITWIGMDLPGTVVVYPDRKTSLLRCKSTNVAVVLSLLYNMVLIILCTVYAFKTRKIPENFNEAKYIAFTMYSTCIVWLAFIPIYFGTKGGDFKIQITALCMCVSISATVNMGCLFAPKVYIVLFQPHKNVRHSVSGTSGGSKRGRPLFGQSSNFCTLNAMNGDVTSPTGLALLIAQSTTNSTNSKGEDSDRDSTKCATKYIMPHTKESASSCIDTSEAEPDREEPAETAL